MPLKKPMASVCHFSDCISQGVMSNIYIAAAATGKVFPGNQAKVSCIVKAKNIATVKFHGG